MKLSDVGYNKEYNKVKNSIKEIFKTDNCLIRTIVIRTIVIAIAFQKTCNISKMKIFIISIFQIWIISVYSSDL